MLFCSSGINRIAYFDVQILGYVKFIRAEFAVFVFIRSFFVFLRDFDQRPKLAVGGIQVPEQAVKRESKAVELIHRDEDDAKMRFSQGLPG